jgi:hypothetical protein
MLVSSTFSFIFISFRNCPCIIGIVPVYLGDADHLKSLLPHPKAAIFVADFPDIPALATYLSYLMTNETAYEEHREWRKSFNPTAHRRGKALLETRWTCRVCQWAVFMAEKEAGRGEAASLKYGIVDRNPFRGNKSLSRAGKLKLCSH